ncbi:hypothetical protein QQ056_14930 [Oscillatoria laete-virens NRMC-F 0139]|nr:hypothetical protein [Oscillatoria laete-virens]MDL5054831.1 hypothetical protein [Oscillatoria laete-virens NRMC-F 0139]
MTAGRGGAEWRAICAGTILVERLVRDEEAGAKGQGGDFESGGGLFASVFSMGVPVKPMNDAFDKASRKLLAKP